MQQVFVGLSLHRPEMITLISEAMRSSKAIFLEEPPAPGFDQMIRGELSIDDYLLPIDVEYPAFSRNMCCLLRELHAEGKKIHQVEPFIESLLSIHEFFAEGHKPDDLTRKLDSFLRVSRRTGGYRSPFGLLSNRWDRHFRRGARCRYPIRPSGCRPLSLAGFTAFPGTDFSRSRISLILYRIRPDSLSTLAASPRSPSVPCSGASTIFGRRRAKIDGRKREFIRAWGPVDPALHFSPDNFTAWVGKAARSQIDDLFENFGETRIGRHFRNISPSSRRTHLHSSRSTTLNRRLPPFVSADSANWHTGSASNLDKLLSCV